jgi:hypothetical protein
MSHVVSDDYAKCGTECHPVTRTHALTQPRPRNYTYICAHCVSYCGSHGQTLVSAHIGSQRSPE